MPLPARVYLGTSGSIGYAYYVHVLNSVTGAVEQSINLGIGAVGGGTRGIAADAAGRIYVVGYETPTLRKYHPDGTLLWSAEHGAKVDRVAVDSSGNVYIAGEAVNNAGTVWDGSQNSSVTWINGTSSARAGYYTTRKYNSSGVLQWSADHSFSYSGLRGIAVDGTGAVYTIGDSFAMAGVVPPLTKYNSDGTIAWRGSLSNTLHTSIAIDSSNNVYVGGGEYNPYFLEKYSSSGTVLQQKLPIGSSPSAVRFIKLVGSSLYVLQANLVVTEYDTDLNVITTNPAFGGVGHVAYDFDTEGHGYSGFNHVGFSPLYNAHSYTISTGVNRWDKNCTSDADYVPSSCIAVVDVELSGISLPVNLGLCTTQGYLVHFPPALALPIRIGTPAQGWTLALLINPPTLIRLWLTGGIAAIEIPIDTFNCRRRLNGSLTLSVSCPTPTLDLITAIEDRIAGYLVLLTGYRFSNGQEQLQEFVRVPLSSIDWVQNHASGQIILGGSTTEIAMAQKTRVATGVSYRTAINGVRRIRCAIDFNLSPGDLFQFGGGETFIANEISYVGSVVSSVMEVAEAG